MANVKYDFYYYFREKIKNAQYEKRDKDVYYPIENIVNFDGDDIKKYYEKNFKNVPQSFLTKNCVCATKVHVTKNGYVDFFAISAIIVPDKLIEEASDKDVWEYVRFDFDLFAQKDFVSHPVPHMHVVVQRNGECIDSLSRFPSFQPTKYLIYNVIDSICKMADPDVWWDGRIDFMFDHYERGTFEILDFFDSLGDNLGFLGKKIVDEEHKELRKNISQWNEKYYAKMKENNAFEQYFEIPLDPEFDDAYGIYNTIIVKDV